MSTKVLPSERLFNEFREKILAGTMSLTELVQHAIRTMLQHGVELEVGKFLGRDYYCNDPEATAQHGRRNGYESRTILTGEGAVTIDMPQVRDLPENAERFHSQLLEAYGRRTATLDEIICKMYVLGMSTRDIESAFTQVFAGEGISRSSVSQITERLNDDLDAFRRRDLSNEHIVYLFLDGTYIKYRVESERKEPVLAAYGINANGQKTLLYVGPGHRESSASWKTFLHEMTRRGLKTPLMIITDGNPGVIDAGSQVFPNSLHQRCQKHKMENILSKLPKDAADELQREIWKSFHAADYESGVRIGKEVIERFKKRFPSAIACLEHDLEACLQCLKLPAEHQKKIRTTNLLERLFEENRRRVKVIPHFFTEQAGMKLVYATLLSASQKWRGVRMDAFIQQQIDAVWQQTFKQTRAETWAA
jgi:transposase-like protein